MELQEHLSYEQADDFALGAMSEAAGDVASRHLSSCEACRARVAAAERALVQLALQAPRRRASPRLRQRVFEDTGIRPHRSFRRLGGYLPAAAALGALFVAAGAFAGLISLRSDVDELRETNAGLRVQVADTRGYQVEIAALTEQVGTERDRVNELLAMSQEDRELMAVLLSPQRKIYGVSPAGAAAASGPGGSIIWDEANRRVWLVMTSLDQLPADQTYQLWVSAGGRYRSLGTFRPDDTGFVRYSGYLAGNAEDYDSAVVTIERAGGAPERRGESVFVSLIRLAQPTPP